MNLDLRGGVPVGHAVRTPGGLAKRLGRVLLWLLVLVLLLRGLASVFAPQRPAPVTRVVRRRRRCGRMMRRGRSRRTSRGRICTTRPTIRRGRRGRCRRSSGPSWRARSCRSTASTPSAQSVGAVSVASAAQLDSRHALVTVAAATSSGTRYLTVPVATDGHGGLVVSALPSFAAGPARAVLEPTSVEPVPASERPAIEDVTTRFLRAYLGGDAGGLAYLVPSGVRFGAVAQRLELVSVDSLALASPAAGRERTVLVSARAKDMAGVVYGVGYRLLLVREDRWLVKAVNATRKGG